MEQKKEDKEAEKAEEAQKNAIEILKRKNPNKFEEEYKTIFEKELKKIEENQGHNFEQLENQLEEKTQKIEELTDTLKRLQAEFENFKKRTEKEKAEFMGYANAGIIANLLPVIDTFEIAFKNTNDKDKFIEGMKMVYAQLHTLLEAEGLKPIRALGEKFDPYKHEVLLKEQSEKPEDTILEEFQKGYMLNDKVIRHSKVKISGK